MDMDSELLAERLVDQTELLFRSGPQKQIGKHARANVSSCAAWPAPRNPSCPAT